MKVVSGYQDVKRYKKPLVALGVFDGMHRAHTHILKDLVVQSQRRGGTSVVVTFSPHPQGRKSLYSLEHRLRLMRGLGINICIVIRFNKKFSRVPAEDFVKDILVDKIRAHEIYVGANFKFGRGAKGDVRVLKRLSRIHNFRLRVFKVIKQKNKVISSTRVRKVIAQGKLKTAQDLLSRPVTVLGTVIRGDSLATHLGFPTANIDPHHEVLPPNGVYAIKGMLSKQRLRGVCYIGTKPTLKARMKDIRKRRKKYIETYLFNFRKNLYGRYLEIEFIKKIRKEKKFNSLASLVKQVRKDILAAKELFSSATIPPQYMPI